jgi:hypothetical protein
MRRADDALGRDQTWTVRAPLVAAWGALFSGALAVLTILSGGCASRYLAQILLARWVGSAGYGEYSYALALAQVLATLGGLGFAPRSHPLHPMLPCA